MQTRRQRLLIVSCYWISTFTDGAARIMVPLFFASLGVGAIKVAFLFFFFEGFGLLTNIYGGLFINRYGYKRSLIISLVLHSLASTVYLSVDTSVTSMTLLLVSIAARSLRGIAKELIKTTCSAYVKQSKGKRSRAIQVLLGGKDTTKGLGILAGGILLPSLGFTEAFLVLGLCTVLATLFAYLWASDFREKHRIRLNGFAEVKAEMKLLAIARAFLYAGRDLWLVIAVPVFSVQNGISPTLTALILACGLLGFGSIQPLFSHFLRASFASKARWRHRPVLLWSSGALIPIPLGLSLLPHSVPMLAAIVILYNLIAGIATVPHNHLHVKFARKKRASIDISYYKTVAQLGKSLAILASGPIFAVFGLKGCLIASAMAITCATLISLPLQRLAPSTQ